MKIKIIFTIALSALLALRLSAQTGDAVDAEQKRAAEWVATLKLDDAAKTARLTETIAAHLKAVRNWHNEHSATNVPAGINPITGKKLSELDRQVIADSTLPKSVHEKLLTGLRQDLSEEQVAAVLDKYTVGKVAFTLAGYHAIIPDLKPEEEEFILLQLQQAREEAMDYKNMKEISTIFKIHKTQIEQWLNDHGRDWKKLYKDYTATVIAKKKSSTGTNSVPAND